MFLRRHLSFLLLPVFFGLGWWGAGISRSAVKDHLDSKSDVIRTSSSVSIASSSRGAGAEKRGERLDVDPRFDLTQDAVRDRLEKTIRGVPYSFLKQLYLERQDQEWKKSDQRYSRIPLEDEQAQKKQTEELFALFQKNSNGASFFMTTAEWALRGGKRVPVTLLAQLTSSIDTERGSTQGDASLATQGSELCYSVSIYFKVATNGSSHYASEGTGSCLRWPTVRDGKPFVLFDNYAKQLTPFFDKVSAPLPGFGSDNETDPEWYDSSGERWTALPRVRWDSITREDYFRFQADLQGDTFRD